MPLPVLEGPRPHILRHNYQRPVHNKIPFLWGRIEQVNRNTTALINAVHAGDATISRLQQQTNEHQRARTIAEQELEKLKKEHQNCRAEKEKLNREIARLTKENQDLWKEMGASPKTQALQVQSSPFKGGNN